MLFVVPKTCVVFPKPARCCVRGLTCVVCPENEPADVVFEG